MALKQEALIKLQQYARKVNEQIDIESISPDEEEAYANQLNRSLQSLQNQVEGHEARLEKLRATTLLVSIERPNKDSLSRMRQLRTISAAYKAITLAEPLLTSPDSPLPALLALRSTLRLIDETKISIRGCREQSIDAQSRLRREASDLQDTLRMTNALERRADKLRLEKAELVQSGPEETMARFLKAKQQRQPHYAKELKGLVGAFNKFIDEHLAILILAEQLGGPVVGDDLSVDEAMLRLGFNKLGKVKKRKAAKSRTDDGRVDMDEHNLPGTIESKAAGAGFRQLTEELLNALADENNRDSYVFVGPDSAAVRFLVRAKVAQFDPEDARKLRLMDFGAELEGDS